MVTKQQQAIMDLGFTPIVVNGNNAWGYDEKQVKEHNLRGKKRGKNTQFYLGSGGNWGEYGTYLGAINLKDIDKWTVRNLGNSNSGKIKPKNNNNLNKKFPSKTSNQQSSNKPSNSEYDPYKRDLFKNQYNSISGGINSNNPLSGRGSNNNWNNNTGGNKMATDETQSKTFSIAYKSLYPDRLKTAGRQIDAFNRNNTNPFAFTNEMKGAEQANYNINSRYLKDSYNEGLQNTVNNLSRRGLFGSSIADTDIGNVNQRYTDNLSELASGTQNRLNAVLQQDLANKQYQKQLDLQQYSDQLNQLGLFNQEVRSALGYR